MPELGAEAVPESATVMIPSTTAMEQAGERLGRLLHPGDVIVLTGPLGAGKTTLTRGIARGLGIVEGVQSPTFVIVRSYALTAPEDAPAVTFNHVDAYRLRDPMEFDDLDLDVDASITVIEWGAPFVDVVADTWLTIALDVAGEGTLSTGDDIPDVTRHGTLTPNGDRWTSRMNEIVEAFTL